MNFFLVFQKFQNGSGASYTYSRIAEPDLLQDVLATLSYAG